MCSVLPFLPVFPCDAQRIQDLILLREHFRLFLRLHMIVAAQMQHAVRGKKGEFPAPGMPVLLSLAADPLGADHDIAEQQMPALRIEAAEGIFLRLFEPGRSGKFADRK